MLGNQQQLLLLLPLHTYVRIILLHHRGSTYNADGIAISNQLVLPQAADTLPSPAVPLH